jgi:predicted transcriptional regulator
MTDSSSPFDPVDDEVESRAIAKARAEIAAGQGVPHTEVIKWLESWGKPNELPAPQPKQR